MMLFVTLFINAETFLSDTKRNDDGKFSFALRLKCLLLAVHGEMVQCIIKKTMIISTCNVGGYMTVTDMYLTQVIEIMIVTSLEILFIYLLTL